MPNVRAPASLSMARFIWALVGGAIILLATAWRTLLAIFNTVDDAANAVASITSEGITPVALEMLDGKTLRCVEEATHAGYPMDSGAVLLIELEGLDRSAVTDVAPAIELQ